MPALVAEPSLISTTFCVTNHSFGKPIPASDETGARAPESCRFVVSLLRASKVCATSKGAVIESALSTEANWTSRST